MGGFSAKWGWYLMHLAFVKEKNEMEADYIKGQIKS